MSRSKHAGMSGIGDRLARNGRSASRDEKRRLGPEWVIALERNQWLPSAGVCIQHQEKEDQRQERLKLE